MCDPNISFIETLFFLQASLVLYVVIATVLSEFFRKRKVKKIDRETEEYRLGKRDKLPRRECCVKHVSIKRPDW